MFRFCQTSHLYRKQLICQTFYCIIIDIDHLITSYHFSKIFILTAFSNIRCPFTLPSHRACRMNQIVQPKSMMLPLCGGLTFVFQTNFRLQDSCNLLCFIYLTCCHFRRLNLPQNCVWGQEVERRLLHMFHSFADRELS